MYNVMTSLAVALQSGKGSFALLPGSGISRNAGIPTGWEIVLDLVERIATAEGDPFAPNLEAWFRKKYGEQPSYSLVLARLAPTSPARQQLLRSFFEPNQEEREQGLKLPSPAHKAIAELVRLGAVTCYRHHQF